MKKWEIIFRYTDDFYTHYVMELNCVVEIENDSLRVEIKDTKVIAVRCGEAINESLSIGSFQFNMYRCRIERSNRKMKLK